MKLREYGNPSECEWKQETIGDISAHLADLCDRECEYMEKRGRDTFGDGPLAVRMDLVEKARELLDVAESGDVKIMRQLWKKVCKK